MSMIDTARDLYRERAWLRLLNHVAPAAIITAIVSLAGAIIIGEWRDGTLGTAKVADVRAIVFTPQVDGTLRISLTAPDNSTRELTLPSATEGFVATMSRSLARERRRYDVVETLPYRLTRYSDGRIALKDPLIGTDVRLEAFGHTNARAFAQLLMTQGQ